LNQPSGDRSSQATKSTNEKVGARVIKAYRLLSEFGVQAWARVRVHRDNDLAKMNTLLHIPETIKNILRGIDFNGSDWPDVTFLIKVDDIFQ
jgi:hypothetical protein